MTACGVWLAPRGLVAVLVDDAGRARSCSVALTDDARSGLALWLAAAGADLVVDEALLGADPFADVARCATKAIGSAGRSASSTTSSASTAARR